ncbi:hypothetical protein FO519_002682 [Halicephalobus sp. NKZ332]|nr:hypothetical protein FO519_002682 [Halicephalobus sp. NKZ332]
MFSFGILGILGFFSLTSSSIIRLDQELCAFRSPNYSLQWAYEPHSRNVVFILKQKSDKSNFWTGVGFGDRRKEFLDFIGIFLKNGQIGIADTYIDPSEGSLTPDRFTNVQSISVDYSNGTLTAKFARSIDNPDEEQDHSLSGCQILNFAVNGGAISRAGISPNFDEIKEKKICDIEKYCLVDLGQQKETQNQSEKKKENPEFAHSVDISGTGDPCSFAGVGYTVNWTYNPSNDQVDFVMKHPIKQGKWWSAVGIGDTMADMDIAIMFISSGRPKRIRDYFSGSYGPPDEDKQNDWILSRQRTKSVDGMIELGFSRKLETDDTEHDRSLDGCVLLQFAANGGRYGSGYAVRKHEDWPDLYKACDLKKHCVAKDTNKRQEPEFEDSLDEDKEEVPSTTGGGLAALFGSNTIGEAVDPGTTLSPDLSGVATSSVEGLIQSSVATNLETTGGESSSESGFETTLSLEFSPGASTSEGANADLQTTPNSALAVSGETTLVSGATSEVTSETTPETTPETTTEATTTPPWTMPPDFVPMVNGELNTSNPDASNLRTAPASAEITETTEAGATTEGVSPTPLQGDFGLISMISNNLENLGLSLPGSPENPGSSEVSPTVVSGGNSASLETSGNPETPTGIPIANSGETTPLSGEVTTEQSVTVIVSGGDSVENTDVTAIPTNDSTGDPRGFVPPVSGGGSSQATTAPSGATESVSSGAPLSPEGSASSEAPLNPEGSAPSGVTESGASENIEGSGTTINANPESTTAASPAEVPASGESTTGAVSGEATTIGLSRGNLGEVQDGSASESGENASSQTVPPTAAGDIGIPSGSNAPIEVSGATAAPTSGDLSGGPASNETTTLNSSESSVSNPPESVTSAPSEPSTLNTSESVTVNPVGGSELPITGIPNIVEITPISGESTTSSEVVVSGATTLPEGVTTAPGSAETTANFIESIFGGLGSGESGTTSGASSEVTSGASSGTPGTEPVSPTALPTGSESSSATPGDGTLSPVILPVEIISSPGEAGTTSGTEIVSPTILPVEPGLNPGASEATSESSGAPIVFPTAPSTGPEPSSGASEATSGAGIVSPVTLPAELPSGSGDSGSTTVPAETTNSSPVNFDSTASSEIPQETSANLPETTGVSAGVTNGAPETTPASNTDSQTTPLPGPLGGEHLATELGPDALGDPSKGCGVNHEDFSLCPGYFQDYLQRVRDWADKNTEPFENQYGKACTLLKGVQNVPSLCCRIYYETCNSHIQL